MDAREIPAVENPFGSPIPELRLDRPPLVRVIAQVQFPPVLAIGREDAMSPFQEALRSRYGILEAEASFGVMVNMLTKESEAKSGHTWRLRDDAGWTVSLAPTFLALDTREFTTSEEFVQRLDEALTALVAHFHPSHVERLGIRSIDQLTGEYLDDLRAYVRPEILGLAGMAPEEATAELVACLAQATFQVDDATLNLRSGLMPPAATLDPYLTPPVPGPSWLLDLDIFVAGRRPFVQDELIEQTRVSWQRLYRFFRWAVTPNLLVRAGVRQ